jgi:DeoR/GlpR family transcriptional regulator of sugar metabolism
VSVTDEGITALARHYGVTEAEVRADLADMSEANRVLGLPGRSTPLENVAMSLIVALNKLTRYGFDDAAVSAAEEIENL